MEIYTVESIENGKVILLPRGNEVRSITVSEEYFKEKLEDGDLLEAEIEGEKVVRYSILKDMKEKKRKENEVLLEQILNKNKK
ncbi:hypothetical protein [Cytobacillus firmus]|uniref:hypothetical protein n=1 Tax=Cytobacillus firmus TaxID=1399 RepID=UPI001CFC88C9|nr:hypothetical protein [Cytobacillus firmus]